jgi:hypothetical protein
MERKIESKFAVLNCISLPPQFGRYLIADFNRDWKSSSRLSPKRPNQIVLLPSGHPCRPIHPSILFADWALLEPENLLPLAHTIWVSTTQYFGGQIGRTQIRLFSTRRLVLISLRRNNRPIGLALDWAKPFFCCLINFTSIRFFPFQI